MGRAAKTTTDHETIRQWVESKGGHPASVKGTGRGDDPGMLRIDFPGFSGEGKLEPLSWDTFFEYFDANGLALLYREQDRFNKLVARETAEARSKGQRRSRHDEDRNLSPQQRAAKTRGRVEERRQHMKSSQPRGKPAPASEQSEVTPRRKAEPAAKPSARGRAATASTRTARKAATTRRPAAASSASKTRPAAESSSSSGGTAKRAGASASTRSMAAKSTSRSAGSRPSAAGSRKTSASASRAAAGQTTARGAGVTTRSHTRKTKVTAKKPAPSKSRARTRAS